MYQRTSEEFKKAAVRKFLSRGSRTIADMSREIGASDNTLYAWSRKYGKSSAMSETQRRPQDLSAAEKMKAVIEFEKLAPEDQGEFLRKQGLHSEHIESWKSSMQAGLSGEAPSGSLKTERGEDKRKIKELERELNRKDKALAETAALLVLKKKADSIWGTGENE